MLGFRWGGSRAGAAAWFVTVIVAVLFFGATPRLLGYSQVKAILLSLDVLYIVWTALLLFHVASDAGAIKIIGDSLRSLNRDRTIQGLLLGWLFASFLQGFGGFGVPVAVTAPLLVGVGFTPIQAVVMACVGHGWAVNFGSMAISFQTMMAVTNLPGEYLAHDSAILGAIACLCCGSLVALIAGGWKGFKNTFAFILPVSLVIGVAQYLLATNRMWVIGSTGGTMAGLLLSLVLLRLPYFKRLGEGQKETQELIPEGARKKSLPVALSVYVVLMILTFSINLVPVISNFINNTKYTLNFPELQTTLGWITPVEMGREINIFGHPGAILFYSSVFAFLIYSKANYYRPNALSRILKRVIRGAINSSLGVVTMVGMAVVMSHTGMTNILAEGLSHVFGAVMYPVVAPLIGALGAFITGSNNNSNVLFAVLQMRAAELLGLRVPLILGAQTVGGSLGSIMAPTKVIVGCSTVGLGNNEGMVMRKVVIYGIIPILFISLVTGLFVWL